MSGINSDIPESVRIISEMEFKGNIIPHEWYKHIRFGNGKVDVNSIIILAEIVYWHRLSPVKDEVTKQVLSYKKRFDADLLQKSYDDLAEKFELSKRQVTDSIKRLEGLGLIERELRIVSARGRVSSNVLHIKLNAEKVVEITRPFGRSHVSTSHPLTVERDTYTKITTKSIKRYSLSQNGAYVINSYISRYKSAFGKEHPSITTEQFESVAEFIEDIDSVYLLDDERWDEIIDYHFDNLSGKNDGNILSFTYGDSMGGPVMRYISSLDY